MDHLVPGQVRRFTFSSKDDERSVPESKAACSVGLCHPTLNQSLNKKFSVARMMMNYQKKPVDEAGI